MNYHKEIDEQIQSINDEVLRKAVLISGKPYTLSTSTQQINYTLALMDCIDQLAIEDELTETAVDYLKIISLIDGDGHAGVFVLDILKTLVTLANRFSIGTEYAVLLGLITHVDTYVDYRATVLSATGEVNDLSVYLTAAKQMLARKRVIVSKWAGQLNVVARRASVRVCMYDSELPAWSQALPRSAWVGTQAEVLISTYME